MALGWLVGHSAEISTYGHEAPCHGARRTRVTRQAGWPTQRGSEYIALAAASQVLKPFSRGLCPCATPHPPES